MIGIYSITSKHNPNKIYIGSARNIEKRWKNHLTDLRFNRHHSKILQNHFNKYGINDLQFSVIEECSIANLIIREQYFIDSYGPKFNIRKIADNNAGLKRSDSTKKKMSDAWKTRSPMSEETKKKISMSMSGRIVSDSFKEKMRNITKGKKRSETTKEKLRNIHLGKKLSDEHKEKIRIKVIGNKSRTGYKETEDHKKWRLSMIKNKVGRKSKNASLREIESGFSTKLK